MLALPPGRWRTVSDAALAPGSLPSMTWWAITLIDADGRRLSFAGDELTIRLLGECLGRRG